jgi:hypothetical protein
MSVPKSDLTSSRFLSTYQSKDAECIDCRCPPPFRVGPGKLYDNAASGDSRTAQKGVLQSSSSSPSSSARFCYSDIEKKINRLRAEQFLLLANMIEDHRKLTSPQVPVINPQIQKIQDGVINGRTVHQVFVSYQANGIRIEDSFISTQSEYQSITDNLSSLNKTANIAHQHIIKTGTLIDDDPSVERAEPSAKKTNTEVVHASSSTSKSTEESKIKSFFSSVQKTLKLGNTHLNIERNQINTFIALIGIVLLIVTLMGIAGTGVGAGGLVAGLFALMIVVLIILVATKKISVQQAIVYGLIITIMLSLIICPGVGPIALLSFKIIYGVAVLCQGLIFGIPRGILGLAIEDRKNFKIAQALGTNARPVNAILGNVFTILKGIGYFVVGALKISYAICQIVMAAHGVPLPDLDLLKEVIVWCSRIIYYALNSLSLIPKIITSMKDSQNHQQYQNDLNKIFGTGSVAECTNTLRWLQQNLIKLDLNPGSDQKHLQRIMQNIHAAIKQTDESLCELSANYEYLESLLTSLREGDATTANHFITHLLASNKQKLTLAKTQKNVSLAYMIGNPILFFLGDLTSIPGFVDNLAEHVFNVTPDHPAADASHHLNDLKTTTDGDIVQKTWENLASAARTQFAAKIYTETRDKIDNPPPQKIKYRDSNPTIMPIPQVSTYPHYDVWHTLWKKFQRSPKTRRRAQISSRGASDLEAASEIAAIKQAAAGSEAAAL